MMEAMEAVSFFPPRLDFSEKGYHSFFMIIVIATSLAPVHLYNNIVYVLMKNVFSIMLTRSFPYKTLQTRMPIILTNVINDVHVKVSAIADIDDTCFNGASTVCAYTRCYIRFYTDYSIYLNAIYARIYIIFLLKETLFQGAKNALSMLSKLKFEMQTNKEMRSMKDTDADQVNIS